VSKVAGGGESDRGETSMVRERQSAKMVSPHDHALALQVAEIGGWWQTDGDSNYRARCLKRGSLKTGADGFARPVWEFSNFPKIA
jgi:hypothetical protein